MRNMRTVCASLFCLSLLLSAIACKGAKAPVDGKAPQAGQAVPAEVRSAIEKYLTEKRGIDVTKMEVTLSNFTEKDGAGTCDAFMTLKGAPEGMPAYDYIYTLAKAEGAWSVTASAPKTGEGHAAAMPPANAMPEGHPPTGGMNPHAGVPGAPPLASGHGEAQPAPEAAPEKK